MKIMEHLGKWLWKVFPLPGISHSPNWIPFCFIQSFAKRGRHFISVNTTSIFSNQQLGVKKLEAGK